MSHTKIGSFGRFKAPMIVLALMLSDHTKRTPCGENFICPVCGKEHPELNHGDAYECDRCGAKYRSQGNKLEVWGHPDIYTQLSNQLTREAHQIQCERDEARSAIYSAEQKIALLEKYITEARRADSARDDARRAVRVADHKLGLLTARANALRAERMSRSSIPFDCSDSMNGADILIARAKSKAKAASKTYSKPGMPEGLDGLIDQINTWAKSDDESTLVIGLGGNGMSAEFTISKSKS